MGTERRQEVGEDMSEEVVGERKAVCKLCCSSRKGILSVDVLLSAHGLTSHYFCLLFSSGLGQAGAEGEGLRGFLPGDINREAKRGARLKCVYCRKKGATVGCAEAKCKKSYHLSCGNTHKALFQFYDQFKSYCREHRPAQRMQRKGGKGEAVCVVCNLHLPRKTSLSTLVAPCCSTFLHKDCIQGKALGGSGRDCPNCGDDEQWLAEVRRMGVYVPEPSTALPTDEMVASSKQESEGGCTAKICFCDQKGSRNHGDQGSWRLVGCQECGGSPIHVACGGLDDSRVSWHCSACRRLRREQGKELREGVLWEARERLLAASSLSSHPPTKTPLLASRSVASEPLKRITAETSFTDLLGCMLDAGEGEASPGDSDYESSSQETRTSVDCQRHFLDTSKGIVDLRKPHHGPSSNSHKANARPFPRQLT